MQFAFPEPSIYDPIGCSLRRWGGGCSTILYSWYNTRLYSPFRPDAKSKLPTHPFLTASVSFFNFWHWLQNQQGCYWNQESKDYQAILSTGSFQAKQNEKRNRVNTLPPWESGCPNFFTREDTQKILSKNTSPFLTFASRNAAERDAIWRYIWHKRTTSQAPFLLHCSRMRSL